MHSTIRAALVVLTALSSHAADWPRWRGPAGNGISSETVEAWPANGPRKLWQAEVGIGFSSISVAQGRVYTMGFTAPSDVVICLDAVTGKVLWRHTDPGELMENVYEGGPNATPTVNDGTVFTFNRRGVATALNATTGRLIWQRDVAREVEAKMPTWGFSSSPFLDGGLVLLNLGDAGVALDRKTGVVKWYSGKGAAGYATAVPFEFKGRHLVAMFSSRELVALDPQTGTVAWRHPWRTMDDINAADPVAIGDRLLLSSGDNRGAALLQLGDSAPKVLWENKNLRAQFTPPVVLGGWIYGFDGNAGERATLRCIDPATGEPKWTGPAVGTGGLLAAGNRLIVLSDQGELVLFDVSAAGFKVLARHQILGGKCWTNPALSNGRLYSRNARGNLVCHELAPAH